jgi:hypothetical protein
MKLVCLNLEGELEVWTRFAYGCWEVQTNVLDKTSVVFFIKWCGHMHPSRFGRKVLSKL